MSPPFFFLSLRLLHLLHRTLTWAFNISPLFSFLFPSLTLQSVPSTPFPHSYHFLIMLSLPFLPTSFRFFFFLPNPLLWYSLYSFIAFFSKSPSLLCLLFLLPYLFLLLNKSSSSYPYSFFFPFLLFLLFCYFHFLAIPLSSSSQQIIFPFSPPRIFLDSSFYVLSTLSSSSRFTLFPIFFSIFFRDISCFPYFQFLLSLSFILCPNVHFQFFLSPSQSIVFLHLLPGVFHSPLILHLFPTPFDALSSALEARE